MKKLKFLPSVLMLAMCIAVLCVGVFSLTPTENTIGGTINISSMARVKLTCYVDEEVVYDSQNTAYGVDWDLTETALNFDVSNYTDASQVPLRTIRIHIQNLTGLQLGVYFYNGQESTLQTLSDGVTKVATYDSLQLSDAVYKANAEEIDANKLIDITLSPYGYIAPANGDNTYDEYDMFINFDVVNLDITEVSKVISYMLRIEEYQSNVTINGSNVATFTPIEGKTKQLVKLPTNNTNTTVPTLADASYGGVVIPTSYTAIGSINGCTGLTGLAVPQSITSFSKITGCSGIKQIDWHMVSNPSFRDDEGSYLPTTYTTLNVASSVGIIYRLHVGSGYQLKNVHISRGVSKICDFAFNACNNIITVNIPDTVTSLGDDPKDGGLPFKQSVILKYTTSGGTDGVEAYVFKDGQLTIYAMPNLTGWTGPSWYNACLNYYVKSVVFECNPAVICSMAFFNSGITSITIPDSVVSINGNAFYYCDNLSMITLPDGLSKIEENAFSYCTSLKTITIPSTVTTLSCPFSGCSDITINIQNYHSSFTKGILSGASNVNLKIESGAIGSYEFSNTDNLVSVTIGAGVKSMGQNAFDGCENLQSVTIEEGLTLIEMETFYGCAALTSIVISSSVEYIGELAFEECSNLSSVTLSEGLETIEMNAFTNCVSLTSVIIPNSVTYIGEQAFSGCAALRKVFIPKHVEDIYVDNSEGFETYTFSGCDASLQIYTDVASASEIPAGWSEGWNYNGSTYLTVNYGETKPTNW